MSVRSQRGAGGGLGRRGRGSHVDPPTPRADGKLQVLLGAHSLSQPEPSKRLYDVLRAVPHPDSRPDTIDHDLLLLQVCRAQPQSRLLHATPAAPPPALTPRSRPFP